MQLNVEYAIIVIMARLETALITGQEPVTEAGEQFVYFECADGQGGFEILEFDNPHSGFGKAAIAACHFRIKRDQHNGGILTFCFVDADA